MRLAFMGSPDFATPALRALHEAGHEIVAVYCQPPRPAGRGQTVRPCPVQRAAESLGLPVRHPARLRRDEAEHAAFRALDLDAAVVAAYGLILPRPILAAPRFGCFNIHASLLPRWRGAAPIQRAVEAGDSESGVTVMRMEAGLDTGPMLLKSVTPIGAEDTGGTLHDRLAELGPPAVLQAIAGLAAGTLDGEVQDDRLATYAHKLNKDEARIDWNRPAVELERLIRAFNPWPVCHSTLSDEALKVLAASVAEGQGKPGEILAASKDGLIVATGAGALCLTRLQLPGGKALNFSDLFNSRREKFALGTVLGQ